MERTIHGITWKDPLAWMEDMKGKRWKEFIKTEQEHWQTRVEKTKPLLRNQLESELKNNEPFMFGNYGVQIAMKGTVNIAWRFEDRPEHKAIDVELCKKYPGFVWAVEEAPDSHGAEQYALRLYVKERDTPVWKHSTPIAPTVAVVGNRIYCIEAKQKLVYFRVVSYNALKGDDRRIHYEEKDARYNLELICCDCNSVIVRRQAGSKQDCMVIGVKGDVVMDDVSLESRRFVLSNERDCYFVWEHRTGWRMSKGLMKHGLQFPSMNRSMNPEYIDCKRGWCITRWKGERTLWKLSKHSPARIMWQGMGQILPDPYEGPMFRFTMPGCETVWWNSESDDFIPKPIGYSSSVMDTARGCRVVLVEPREKPVGLLITGYGAYGLSTSMSTARWEPLLRRGWYVAIGCWRGGGDHSPEWEDSGRRHGRETVLEDVEDTIQILQEKTHMKPKQTVLYGRSAGGLWVGGMVAKHSTGKLFGGVYMEVPYVDVLRTTTNHSLPLTDLEADEFGLPSQRISDFVSILKWSPMENLPAGGVKGVWQIVRTGLNDSEVYPYEAAKWVVRSGELAYLAVEDGQGHFVSGNVGLKQRAEDLAVLLDLTKGK